MNASRWLVAAPALGAILAGCTIGPKVPEVPPALRPPADQQLFLEAQASGVQIYICRGRVDQPSVWEWSFEAPEATLVTPSGTAIGKHYAGPTWQSLDLSAVVGEVKARDPGPDAKAIPWLLLAAKSTSGNGVFTPTRSVQRVRTTGGVAPLEPCGAANAQAVARVPYTATYYFYR